MDGRLLPSKPLIGLRQDLLIDAKPNFSKGSCNPFIEATEMTETDPAESLAQPSKGTLLVLFLTVFIDLLGFGIVLPLLPVYAKSFAADLSPGTRSAVVGLLMASFSAMQFLFLPIWGRLSDRLGRRPVLLVGLAGSVLFYALFGLATQSRSLLGLFIARVGAGIAGATIATAQASIADCTTAKNRGKGMALIGAAFGLGFTFGPLLGAVALFAGPHQAFSPWPGYLAATLSALALGLGFFLLPETLQKSSQSAGHGWLDLSAWGLAFRMPAVGKLITVAFFATFSLALFESTLSLLIDAVMADSGGAPSPWRQQLQSWGFSSPQRQRDVTVLIAFASLGLALSLAQGLIVRRLAGKIPERLLALAGACVSMFALALLSYGAMRQSIPLLMVGTLIEVVGFSSITPSVQALISRQASASHQGSVLAVGQSVASLARIAGPGLGPVLLESTLWLPYLFSAGLMLVAFSLLISLQPARLPSAQNDPKTP